VAGARERLRTGWDARLALVRDICPRGARVLDVGSSWGEYTLLPLAAVASEVVALDVDTRPLAWLSMFAAERDVTNVTTTVESVHDHRGSYDLLRCTNTLQLLSGTERVAFLSSFRRLLTSEGDLFVDFYTPRYLAFRVRYQKGLGLRLRLVSAARLALWRHTLTVRRFQAETGAVGLRIERHVDSAVYDRCREHEGNDFSTPLGRYFAAFVVVRDDGGWSKHGYR